ncbi:RNA 2'-phosphotransferase [Paracrocinitomix mangrovi]|uniref:RNA 2'-phosphotransferase n=1 Tax=Paracrocinitomix mangrovi TaxID=2862509 RepID=UPI001C8E0C73|nr:RNA 2'-phosphotransferase [Paracrocinitomix mangrovi]UKN03871.1 RNA 2'-phosphotransferase [Paracrocinitomix mangrovi]
MTENEKKHISKFLSLVLRHQPTLIGLELNDSGWADVSEVIEKSKLKNVVFNVDQLKEVVETNDKKRFAFSDDGLMIRANQGHSVKNVDLKLKEVHPPETLYHGTVEKFIDSIKQHGLQKRSRQHVHLSGDIETAQNVGSRRGKPIILKIQAEQMRKDGYQFFLSENKVWLTDHVPTKYLNFK